MDRSFSAAEQDNLRQFVQIGRIAKRILALQLPPSPVCFSITWCCTSIRLMLDSQALCNSSARTWLSTRSCCYSAATADSQQDADDATQQQHSTPELPRILALGETEPLFAR